MKCQGFGVIARFYLSMFRSFIIADLSLIHDSLIYRTLIQVEFTECQRVWRIALAAMLEVEKTK